MTFDFLKSLYADIMTMIGNLVVKRNDLAKSYETTATAKAFDLYYACLRGSRYFYNFEEFDLDILQGYLSPSEAIRCHRDADVIPENLRASIVEDQAKRVINTYEEKNEYYRMLNGLPPIDDHFWIYVKGQNGIPEDVPIHQMSDDQISRLEIYGILDKLKTENPKAEYLNYLGINKIEVIDARLAKPFEILRIGNPMNNRSREMFEGEYYMARRYIMATTYNRDLITTKTMYDPIIGVMILTLAVRNTLVPTEADYLNFEEILNAILESYGLLKYFERFPYTYKRRLVLALDNILKIKGTDGVLVDICKIFSFDNFIANRYYLMKTPKRDVDGNIIFSDDPEEQFDLNFIKAEISDHDISYTDDNIVGYETVTTNDYLWQLTPEEKKEIMNEKFNLMMTKYIDIEAAYDVSALTFEVCYFINLLLQSKENMMTIRCTNSYAANGSSPAYNMIIFLLAALAKRSGFDGNIIYEPEHIAEILRFDMSDISAEMQAIIDKYELLVDVTDKLVPEYEDYNLQHPAGKENANSMTNVYIYNRELYKAICNEMNITNDIRKYNALSELKECMYISTMEEEDFTLSTGEPANTYYEMLKDIDPVLAAKLDKLDITDEVQSNDLDRMILYILEKLEELFNSPELRYLFLNTPSAYAALISKYLRTAINVFKASSVQLDSINIMLNVGDNEPIRVIEKKQVHTERIWEDVIHVQEEVAFHIELVAEDYIRCMDKAYTNE